ncbi:MAG: diguanylate cyclase, partial [Rhodocyclaceae bacterium]|nr:diguanylate cyclase [Rhodocyclaceae bacterium]
MLPRWLINRSFRFKLSVATLVALLAMLGLLGWQTWSVLDAELRGQLHGRIEQTNLLLTSAVALPLAQRDYATLGDIANDLVKQDNAISYLVIEDHRGRHIASTGWPVGQALPTPGDGTDRANGQEHVRQAVRFAAQTLGEFQYGVSLQFLEQARATLAEKMLKIGAIGVLFGLLLLVPLGRWVTRRIEILEAAALRLAAGQLDERIDLPGEDELSRLAGAFNHMADSLSATIGEQKKAARALAYLAHHDALTQLPNRVLLADRMAMALAQARRDDDRLGIALLDLDGFKPINDVYGHDVGDDLLVAVAHRLQANVRHQTDVVARLGGDEFIIMACNLGTANDAEELGRSLLRAFDAPFVLSHLRLRVGLTIGYALAPLDGDDPQALIRLADAAMYAGKQGGKHSLRRNTGDLALSS